MGFSIISLCVELRRAIIRRILRLTLRAALGRSKWLRAILSNGCVLSARSRIQIKMPALGGLFYLNGGPCAIRTRDHLIKSQMLYQLS